MRALKNRRFFQKNNKTVNNSINNNEEEEEEKEVDVVDDDGNIFKLEIPHHHNHQTPQRTVARPRSSSSSSSSSSNSISSCGPRSPSFFSSVSFCTTAVMSDFGEEEGEETEREILNKFSLYPSYAGWEEKLHNIPGLQQFHEDFEVQRVIAEGGEGKLIQVKSRKPISTEIRRRSNNNQRLFAAKFVLCSSSNKSNTKKNRNRIRSKMAMAMKMKLMSEYELMQSSNLLNYYRIYHYNVSEEEEEEEEEIAGNNTITTTTTTTNNINTTDNNDQKQEKKRFRLRFSRIRNHISPRYSRRNNYSHNNHKHNHIHNRSHNSNNNRSYSNNYENSYSYANSSGSGSSSGGSSGYCRSQSSSTLFSSSDFYDNGSGSGGGSGTDAWMIIVSQLFYKSLTQYVQSHTRDMNEERIKPIMRSVVQHLAKLHNENYLHLDLRPDNIMCVARGKNKVWKIIDYGFREQIYTNSQYTRPGLKWKGIFGFTAPEFSVYVQDYKNNQLCFAADIWVIGMLILYCIFGGNTEKIFPNVIYNLMMNEGGNDGNVEIQTKVMHIWYQYLHNNNHGFKQVLKDIERGEYRSLMSEPLQDLLVNHVLIYDPKMRENHCTQLLRHPWFH